MVKYKSEAELQKECTLWYKNEYSGNDIKKKRRLILVYNNPPDARMGAILKSLGLERGVSDQLYFSPIGRLVWIEYKLPGEVQSDEQLIFMMMVKEYSICDYHVVKQKDEFIKLIMMYEV